MTPEELKEINKIDNYPKCPDCLVKLGNLGGLLECPQCNKKWTLKYIGDNEKEFKFNKQNCRLF